MLGPLGTDTQPARRIRGPASAKTEVDDFIGAFLCEWINREVAEKPVAIPLGTP